MSNKLLDIIAVAIKKADKSYIWENYTKQAQAVTKALEDNGYKIVPLNPTESMIKAGINAITAGRTNTNDLARQIYLSMVNTGTEVTREKK
jgi:hypothetical protein